MKIVRHPSYHVHKYNKCLAIKERLSLLQREEHTVCVHTLSWTRRRDTVLYQRTEGLTGRNSWSKERKSLLQREEHTVYVHTLSGKIRCPTKGPKVQRTECITDLMVNGPNVQRPECSTDRMFNGPNFRVQTTLKVIAVDEYTLCAHTLSWKRRKDTVSY